MPYAIHVYMYDIVNRHAISSWLLVLNFYVTPEALPPPSLQQTGTPYTQKQLGKVLTQLNRSNQKALIHIRESMRQER